MLGDAVYERGTAAEYRDCYSWRRFRARTRAALGNHEYGTGSAQASIAYFRLPRSRLLLVRARRMAHRRAQLELPARRAAARTGSPQQRWLEADLAAQPDARCTLAYMHHPRFSSGLHGSDRTMAPLWRTLARGGADVVLAGHDHHYERFRAVSTGSARSSSARAAGATIRCWRLRTATSVRASNDRTSGVLRLTLEPDAYAWQFVPVAGASFRDSGTGRCE